MSDPVYQIKLPEFEGPFDLLLFFIERDELDVYNIPIHKLTADFLAYIHTRKEIDMEQASEFILFASTLMRIKSRMLLPRREKDEMGNEIDPRQELVDKILEYKRFKEAAAALAGLEAERILRIKRGNIRRELEEVGQQFGEGSEMQTVSAYKLMNAFDRVMKRLQERLNKPQHVVVKYNYSMESQRSFLLEKAAALKRISFDSLFSACDNRIHAIFNFLSLLELIQQRYLTILIGTGRNNFIIEWIEVADSENSNSNLNISLPA